MGSLDSSQTTPARVNTCASGSRELLVSACRDERGAGVHHLLRVRGAAEAGDALGAEPRAEHARRRQAVRRDEPLGDRHHRRAPVQAGGDEPVDHLAQPA